MKRAWFRAPEQTQPAVRIQGPSGFLPGSRCGECRQEWTLLVRAQGTHLISQPGPWFILSRGEGLSFQALHHIRIW